MAETKRNLPDWIDAFMLLTEDSEPPILFRKWTAISTIASALQRKCHIRLGISLIFYPNFYVVLVGPSATGKGTVMRYAYDIIKGITSIRLSAHATSLQALIRRMKETNLTDIDVESGRQLYHSSMTIFSEEFTVFLGYHNRELLAALCNWYDCGDVWEYETISRDKEEIIGVWVNILAGTTPDNIQSSFPSDAIGGGLTSRIIFVYEERPNKLVIFPSASEREYELQQRLINDLEQISMMSGSFRMTADAADAYSNWVTNAKENPPFYDKNFDGYCGRRREHLLSLSMVCSASRDNGLVLTKPDIDRAARMLAKVETKMALTLRGVGKSDMVGLINDAIVYIEHSVRDEIPVWEFSRHFEGDMDKMVMDRVLRTLEASNYIKIVRSPGTDQMIRIIDRSNFEQINASETSESS